MCFVKRAELKVSNYCLSLATASKHIYNLLEEEWGGEG